MAEWMILHPRLWLVAVTVATTWGWMSLIGVDLAWRVGAVAAGATAAHLLAVPWQRRALRRYTVYRRVGPGGLRRSGQAEGAPYR